MKEISNEGLEKFIEKYQKASSGSISREEAHVKFSKLLRLIEITYKNSDYKQVATSGSVSL